MNTRHLVLALPVLALAAYSQADDSFFTDSGDFAGFGEETDSFAFDDSGSASSLNLSGKANTQFRIFGNDELIIEGEPSLSLNLLQSTNNQSLALSLKFNQALIDGSLSQLIDQANFSYYGSAFDLSLGLNKVTWGKGDALHVLDVVNGIDLSSFSTQSLNEQKKPALMLKLDRRVGDFGMFELVFLPYQSYDTLPVSGRWTPKQLVDAQNQVYQLIYDAAYQSSYAVTYGGLYTTTYNAAYAQALAQSGDAATAEAAALAAASDSSVASNAALMAAAQADAQATESLEALLEVDQEHSLDNSELALRFTNSIAGIDYGLQYYYGHEKQPSLPSGAEMNLESLSSSGASAISYESLQQLGFDAAFVLLGLSHRLEVAYNQTENSDHYVSYVIGFDRDLGVGNSNLNLQVKGRYTPDQEQSNNLLVAALTDNWFYEKLDLQLALISNIEEKDFVLSSSLGYKLSDNTTTNMAVYWFGGEADSTFGQFEDNSFVELSLEYVF